MISRKGLLFVTIALVSIFTNTHTAEAALVGQELPTTLARVYDFQNDPFLLDWTFNVEKSTVTAPVSMSAEDKILNRWKEKQAQMWNSLPQGTFVINASAYTAAADECGKSDGITSSGLKVAEKRTLACPPSFPFGTKIAIEGMGNYRCEDRGGAIKGNHVDIYVQTKTEAFAFGRQNLTAEVIE